MLRQKCDGKNNQIIYKCVCRGHIIVRAYPEGGIPTRQYPILPGYETTNECRPPERTRAMPCASVAFVAFGNSIVFDGKYSVVL